MSGRMPSQQVQDLGLEKRGVPAKLDDEPSTKAPAQLANDESNNALGAVAIVDVPGAVLHAQNLSRLREMSDQRIVARILRVMGIVSALCPGDLQPRAKHRAIKIDGRTAQTESRDLIEDEIEVDRSECGHRASCEALHPVDDSSWRGDPRQTAEAAEHWITRHILQVLEPPRTHEEQADHNHHEARRAVVATERRRRERSAQPRGEFDTAQESADHLQARVRGEFLGAELDT
jgi:hypothetical protein